MQSQKLLVKKKDKELKQMVLSIAQTPATASLAQSPIIFSIVESTTASVLQDGFQYVADLFYWRIGE